MAKQPRVGFTKTRLCPPFSLQQAADFYEALLLDTLDLVGRIPEIQLAIAITPASAINYFKKISPAGTILFPVDGADIGECLIKTTEFLFSGGYDQVIALNADGPSLPVDYLIQAFKLLNETDLVLGPGEDGGYYLVGLNKPSPEIFQHIDWSTALVLEQTLIGAKKLGLRYRLTPAWFDVDTINEVLRIKADLSQIPSTNLVHTRTFFEQNAGADWQSLKRK